jgi:hypothetical protein
MTSVAIHFEWDDAAEVRLNSAGKLEFPKLSAKPGVYAFRFDSHEAATTVYVGEAENLQRRTAHYRNPGPSQSTNIRLNERMRSHLASNGCITMQLIIRARAEINGNVEECDLSKTFARRLLENAALLAIAKSGQRVETLRMYEAQGHIESLTARNISDCLRKLPESQISSIAL